MQENKNGLFTFRANNQGLVSDSFAADHKCPTGTHVVTQRANVFTFLLNSGVQMGVNTYDPKTKQAVTPAIIIPTSVFQILMCLLVICRKDTKIIERTLNSCQVLFLSAQVGLSIALLYQNKDCSEISDATCQSAILMHLLFLGFLLVTWAPAEVKKHRSNDKQLRKLASEVNTYRIQSRKPNHHFAQGLDQPQTNPDVTIDVVDGEVETYHPSPSSNC